MVHLLSDGADVNAKDDIYVIAKDDIYVNAKDDSNSGYTAISWSRCY